MNITKLQSSTLQLILLVMDIRDRDERNTQFVWKLFMRKSNVFQSDALIHLFYPAT